MKAAKVRQQRLTLTFPDELSPQLHVFVTLEKVKIAYAHGERLKMCPGGGCDVPGYGLSNTELNIIL